MWSVVFWANVLCSGPGNVDAVGLIRDFNDTPLMPHHTQASLHITNIYSNIPVAETKAVLTNMLTHGLTDPQTRQEILGWYDVITKQNSPIHTNCVDSEH